MTDYYHIVSASKTDAQYCYRLALHASCDVYTGHFPGRPISPGACNLEMIRECTEDALAREVRFELIRQCRYQRLVTPAECPELELVFTIDGQQLTACLKAGENTYVTLKATIR